MLRGFKQNIHDFSHINLVNIKGKGEEGEGKIVFDTTRQNTTGRQDHGKQAHVKPWP